MIKIFGSSENLNLMVNSNYFYGNDIFFSIIFAIKTVYTIIIRYSYYVVFITLLQKYILLI